MGFCQQQWVMGAVLLLLAVHVSGFYQSAANFKVVNDGKLDQRVKNGDFQRIIFRDGMPSTEYALVFLASTEPNSFYPPETTFILSVVIHPDSVPTGNPARWISVWSANRDSPVKQNATLQMESSGDLTLRDVDGTLVWSTATKLKDPNAAGLTLDASGNFALVDSTNSSVWESFDHPTDVLLPGQSLGTNTSLISGPPDGSYASGSYRLTARPGGLLLAETSIPYWFQSILASNNTLYNVEHTCLHPNNAFFDSSRGLVIQTDFSKNLTSGVDPSLCAAEANITSLVIIATSPGEGETSNSQFVRMDPNGTLSLYMYNANERAFLIYGHVGK